MSKTERIFWDKKARRPGGGGLLITLPTVTSDRMEQLFGYGAGMKMQRRETYSKTVLIRLKPSNQLFALYMSFGEWRIGHTGTVFTRIGDLLHFLDPIKYDGVQTLRDDIALELADLANQFEDNVKELPSYEDMVTV